MTSNPDPNVVELHPSPKGTWKVLDDPEQLMHDVGALMALKHLIDSSVYRRPVAILVPPGWFPDLVEVMTLPVWRSEQADKPSLVYQY
jgi:hypothetical protein